MKVTLKENKVFAILFFVIFCFLLLSSCDTMTHSNPVINIFTASPLSITAGESATLSWNVTDADNVTLNPGSLTVALSGSTFVSPTTTTTYTLTATNSTGSTTAKMTVIIDQTLTIQPGPEGEDSYENPLVHYIFNPGGNAWLTFGSTNLGGYRSYLQFDYDILPANAEIVSADLKLYQFASIGVRGFVFPGGLHQTTQNWTEDNLIYMTSQPDYFSTPESTASVTVGDTGWLTWNITDLLQGWIDGSIVNYGVVIKAINEGVGNNYINCHSSDYTDNPILCPKLEINYYVP